MVLRSDLRLAVRRRLEDTSGTPLWDDATLNELLKDAFHHYGDRFPAERTLALVAAAGLTELSPSIAGGEIVQVRDPNGALIPRMTNEDDPHVLTAQVWQWWANTLRLSRPSSAGTWQIDYLDRRELPSDDVTVIDLEPGDEEIVVLLAAAGALLRRGTEHAKRGMEHSGLALIKAAEAHEREATQLMRARHRRATGGHLSTL